MVRRLSRVAVTVAVLALLAGCSDTGTSPTSDPAVRGRVLDGQGRPVAGAAIVLQHEVAPVAGSAADKPQLGLQFELAQPGRVHAWIAGYCDDDTVRTLVDGTMPSGSYTLFWDGRDDLDRTAPDGVYRMHIVWDGGQAQHTFVMVGHGYDWLAQPSAIAAAAVTDQRGAFRLEAACLPFGYTFPAYDESGLPAGTATITRRVRVWAFRDGSVAAASDWVTVDPEQGVAVTFAFAE